MNGTVVDKLFEEYQDLLLLLEKANELSMVNLVEENFRKALLLSAASYFEFEVGQSILVYVQSVTSPHELISEFVSNKAISRQFHSYFSWSDAKNANIFFRLFGGGFGEFMKNKVKQDSKLDEAILAFLKIGADRNNLVHKNFAGFPLNNTSKEIYELYKSGLYFIQSLGQSFVEYDLSKKP